MTRIEKVLIANRGEIAVRIARTCREMGIRTVAVYSDPDSQLPHVCACDEAVAIGGAAPSESYLRGEAIVSAALSVGADAIHPGFGFLAENATFAERVEASDLIWIGPQPDAIEAMGDKLTAKDIMRDAGVPVLPSVAVDADTDLDEAGQEVGFPLLVKAAAGGGGKGMRVVRDPDDLADAVDAAAREAEGAFGDGRVFLERFVERPRHVEIQIIGDTHGNLLHLFERECSIQRRHQKVIEETPSTALTPQLRKEMGEAAVAAGRALSYRNAGTVEFVLGRADGRGSGGGDFHFLEVNTRLQVEHPVTEMVCGIDLVRLQLHVARGESLPFTQDEVRQSGHAIEARLYAEDPANDYLPATGTLHAFEPAELPGVRWDTGVSGGSVISPHYDPMLAKVIAHADTRDDAARLLARALEATFIHGVTTNRDLLVTCLRDPGFLAGDTTTAFLDERFPEQEDRTFAPSATAVRQAVIAATLAQESERRREAKVQSTIPSGWRNNRGHEQRARYSHGGRMVVAHYHQVDERTWSLEVDGDRTTVRRFGPGDLEVGGRRFTARLSRVVDEVTGDARVRVQTAAGAVTLKEVLRFPRAGLEEVAGATLAPMPGSVVSVAVEEGDEVAAGDLLVIVEAMKMEHRITAPEDGTVAEVHVADGDQVDAGEVLVVVEPGE